MKLPFIGKTPKYEAYDILIVHDDEYTRVKSKLNEETLTGIMITNPENSLNLCLSILEDIPKIADDLNAYVAMYEYKYYALGAFYFLGCIVSIVFMLATLSTLYFKMLSDALLDKEKFAILKKIGMSKKEVEKTVYMQIAMSFILPTIIGIIHSLVAIKILEDFMKCSFILQSVVSISVFCIFMLVYYFIICKTYSKMVYDYQ